MLRILKAIEDLTEANTLQVTIIHGQNHKGSSYLSYIPLVEKESVVYIETPIELKILLWWCSPCINMIEDNTLVNVKEKVSNTGNYDDLDSIWYRVSIPVYDTPSDYIGWSKLNQTKVIKRI